MRRQRARVRFLCHSILIIATVTAALSFGAPVLSGEPVVGAMSFDPAITRPGGSFSARFSGTSLTNETYFDIRVQSPDSNSDQVVLNWQRGAAAAHTVPPDTILGIWKITGVRAHENSSDHSAPFISISVALTVSSPIVTGLQFDPGNVEPGGSITATFSGTNLTPETYFDVQFRVPCSDQDQVVLNWQRGVSANHGVTARSPTGVWTISGVWAHQDVNDHSADFASLRTALLVSPQSAVPFSGKVTSIVVDPSRSATVYAATVSSGIYKTCDGGETWMAASVGLPNTDILTLALNPASPWIVYAGTGVGVFKSVNDGVSWDAAGSDLLSVPVRALAIDPRRPATIYAATENRGVFKSLDGGLSWSVAGTGLSAAATVQSLAIDPVNSDIVYAGTDVVDPLAFKTRAQVFKSSDGGEHWEDSWLPASSYIVAQTIYALVVDPRNPSVIYAGTLNPDPFPVVSGLNQQAGAFKSLDGGRTWTGLSGLWGQDHRYITSMAIDPINTSTVYAASMYGDLWKSTDAAASWVKLYDYHYFNSPYTGPYTLAIDPTKPSTIYVGDKGTGIFKSTDAAATWQHLDIH